MKRYYIIVRGQVQGVGYRYTVMQIARKYNLTGFVRNLIDGDVDLELQGEEKNLNQALKEITVNHRYIIVEDYFVKEIQIKDESTFDVKY